MHTGCEEGCQCSNGWRHPDGHCVQSGLECPVPPPCRGENEIYTDRAGSCCEANCDSWSCSYEYCWEGCACAPGFIRMNGDCVPEDMCYNQECGENAHFESCSHEDVTGCCDHTIGICHQRKNKNGKKIEHSVGSDWVTAGPAPVAPHPAPMTTTAAPTFCKTGCFCDPGYVKKALWSGEGCNTDFQNCDFAKSRIAIVNCDCQSF